MEWPKELLELFDDPILDDVHPKATPLTADDRRVKALLEITQWSETHENRIPQSDGNLKEKMMARSLAALRKDDGEALNTYDRLNLLKKK